MDSSAGDRDPNLRIDPDNRYLWRMNSRRMEAEIIRDSMLSVTGQLDPTLYGPEIDEAQGETSRRRSLYFRHTPERKVEFLKQFDPADPTECYRRTESVIPQQALAMINSKLSISLARSLAQKLSDDFKEKRNDARFIQSLFQKVLGRFPSPEESSVCQDFLNQQEKLLAQPKKLTVFDAPAEKQESSPEVETDSAHDLRARQDLVQVLLNHNEFITIR